MEKESKKNQSTSITERSRVEYYMWRKKVDNTLLRHNRTSIPQWVASKWKLDKHFPTVRVGLNKAYEASNTKIKFGNEIYEEGKVTCTLFKKIPRYRLNIPKELTDKLKRVFLMSHMRDIESALRGGVGDIETEIPFWEFLDIEFNPDKKQFEFTAYYKQKPMFPELFEHLVVSPALKVIEDKIFGKSDLQIHKQGWKPRENLETEIGANNVVYTLLDKKNKLIYVGEGEDLIRRLQAGHSMIPNWTHYRYDVLPKGVSKDGRLAIERIVIRSHASLFENKRDVESIKISGYRLVNRKIDN